MTEKGPYLSLQVLGEGTEEQKELCRKNLGETFEQKFPNIPYTIKETKLGTRS